MENTTLVKPRNVDLRYMAEKEAEALCAMEAGMLQFVVNATLRN